MIGALIIAVGKKTEIVDPISVNLALHGDRNAYAGLNDAERRDLAGDLAGAYDAATLGDREWLIHLAQDLGVSSEDFWGQVEASLRARLRP